MLAEWLVFRARARDRQDTMARTFVVALSATLCIVAAAAAPERVLAADELQVGTREYHVNKIGRFYPSVSPRLSAAIRAFGRPSRRKLLRSGACRVDWRALKLTIWFENYGGTPPGSSTCTPRWGKAQTFKARGGRFATTEGLRIGDRSAEIADYFPDAVYESGVWNLVRVELPFGPDDELTPILRAQVRGGRVRSFSGYIGGAGE